MTRRIKTAAILEEPALVLEKLKRRVRIDRVIGCHIWQGGSDYYGYGVTYAEGRVWHVHRLMHELVNGFIPRDSEAQWVLHKCDVPACCNPEHLYLGTPADNARDMADRCRMRRGHRISFYRPNHQPDPDTRAGTVFYEFRGEIRPLKELAEMFGLSVSALDQRFRAGWPEKDIPRQPVPGFRHQPGTPRQEYRRFSGQFEVQAYLQSKEARQ